MWSGPRNLSTALMRSFENRNDTLVFDEPFYSYYLKQTCLKHPMYKEIIKTYPFESKIIIKKITEMPNKYSIYYQKHMTHHILDEIDLDWLKVGKNCFLIRHPAKVINSYIKKNDIKNIGDIGFKKQYQIFNYVKNKFDPKPIVINSDNILKDPKKIIKKLCQKLKIKFTKNMITWPIGEKINDGIWGRVWYEQVNNSTTFAKYKDSELNVPKKYQDIYQECIDIYNHMNKFSI